MKTDRDRFFVRRFAAAPRWCGRYTVIGSADAPVMISSSASRSHVAVSASTSSGATSADVVSVGSISDSLGVVCGSDGSPIVGAWSWPGVSPKSGSWGISECRVFFIGLTHSRSNHMAVGLLGGYHRDSGVSFICLNLSRTILHFHVDLYFIIRMQIDRDTVGSRSRSVFRSIWQRQGSGYRSYRNRHDQAAMSSPTRRRIWITGSLPATGCPL